jgi:hypothetical protein
MDTKIVIIVTDWAAKPYAVALKQGDRSLNHQGKYASVRGARKKIEQLQDEGFVIDDREWSKLPLED